MYFDKRNTIKNVILNEVKNLKTQIYVFRFFALLRMTILLGFSQKSYLIPNFFFISLGIPSL